MRSIMKQTIPTNRPSESNQEGVAKRRKTVRFDDMILIGDDEHQVQIFLSDEEASIIEKKATPTKLNLQSSSELRKRMKRERQEKL